MQGKPEKIGFKDNDAHETPIFEIPLLKVQHRIQFLVFY